jgi:hypothetical protein
MARRGALAHAVVFRDSTGAERSIGPLSAQPRRYRALARSISRNKPPFHRVKNERRDSQPDWGAAGIRKRKAKDASVQRYKGLGEMNAEQRADATMNPEKRTLLKCAWRHGAVRRDFSTRGRGKPAQVHRRKRAGRQNLTFNHQVLGVTSAATCRPESL